MNVVGDSDGVLVGSLGAADGPLVGCVGWREGSSVGSDVPSHSPQLSSQRSRNFSDPALLTFEASLLDHPDTDRVREFYIGKTQCHRENGLSRMV